MIKKGDTVYFVNVSWGNKAPEMFTRVVTSATEKQYKLDGYGPNLTVRFWRAPDGTPRHSDYFGGEIPCFYLTKEAAIEGFITAQKHCLEQAQKQAAQCEANIAVAVAMSLGSL